MSDTITGAPSLESLSERATPGPWHHCQPFQTVPATRTVHGPVAGQRVDYISTWPGPGTPPGHRIIVPMEGRESTMSSHDMALVARLVSDFRASRLHTSEALAQAVAAAREETDWRDIATAPKDKTRVLVAVPSLHAGEPTIVGEAYFDPDHEGGAWWWSGTGPGSYHDSPIHETNAMPTHWRPLPAPPTPAQTDTAPGGRADGGR